MQLENLEPCSRPAIPSNEEGESEYDGDSEDDRSDYEQPTIRSRRQ